jgi:hypothetical protein
MQCSLTQYQRLTAQINSLADEQTVVRPVGHLLSSSSRTAYPAHNRRIYILLVASSMHDIDPACIGSNTLGRK